MTTDVSTLVEELIGHVRATTGPDRGRILRTRGLVADLVRAAPRPASAEETARAFNNVYLMLQFAALSDDPADARSYRAECLDLAQALGGRG